MNVTLDHHYIQGHHKNDVGEIYAEHNHQVILRSVCLESVYLIYGRASGGLLENLVIFSFCQNACQGILYGQIFYLESGSGVNREKVVYGAILGVNTSHLRNVIYHFGENNDHFDVHMMEILIYGMEGKTSHLQVGDGPLGEEVKVP